MFRPSLMASPGNLRGARFDDDNYYGGVAVMTVMMIIASASSAVATLSAVTALTAVATLSTRMFRHDRSRHRKGDDKDYENH